MGLLAAAFVVRGVVEFRVAWVGGGQLLWSARFARLGWSLSLTGFGMLLGSGLLVVAVQPAHPGWTLAAATLTGICLIVLGGVAGVLRCVFRRVEVSRARRRDRALGRAPLPRLMAPTTVGVLWLLAGGAAVGVAVLRQPGATAGMSSSMQWQVIAAAWGFAACGAVHVWWQYRRRARLAGRARDQVLGDGHPDRLLGRRKPGPSGPG